jgi:5-methylcytosine-specific restriction enzyme A
MSQRRDIDSGLLKRTVRLMTASGALIVTWNPDKGKWHERGEYQDAIERTARGEPAEVVDWSTGNRRRGVSTGDRVFLLRQGNQGRGIVASGTVRGKICQAKHWDPDRPGELANNVKVQWDHVVEVEDALPTDKLQRQLPARHNWSFQRSGVLIERELADQLEELWKLHIAHVCSAEGGLSRE